MSIYQCTFNNCKICSNMTLFQRLIFILHASMRPTPAVATDEIFGKPLSCLFVFSTPN